VTPSVHLEPLTAADRTLAGRLWQLYRHDLSEFWGGLPGIDGLYPEERLAIFFDDPDRCGYLIRSTTSAGHAAPAGFALVRNLSAEPRVLGEFFVVRAVRGRGVGSAAAHQVLARHPGAWEIAFQEENPGAARFWRRVATETAGDSWRDEPRPVPSRPDLPPDIWLSLHA
jgi:predicted acetyltransferase